MRTDRRHRPTLREKPTIFENEVIVTCFPSLSICTCQMKRMISIYRFCTRRQLINSMPLCKMHKTYFGFPYRDAKSRIKNFGWNRESFTISVIQIIYCMPLEIIMKFRSFNITIDPLVPIMTLVSIGSLQQFIFKENNRIRVSNGSFKKTTSIFRRIWDQHFQARAWAIPCCITLHGTTVKALKVRFSVKWQVTSKYQAIRE